MKESNGKTISMNDDLKENLKRAMERLNSLQLKNELLQRENVASRNELADANFKLTK